jgi:hypothetical protein
MSFFVQFPHAFAKAAKAADEGDKAFQACLTEFVTSCIFADVEQAGKAFEAAREQAAAALLATQRTEALEAGQKALKGVTFSKSLTAKLTAALETATVLDPETGEPNNVSILLKLEGEGDQQTLVASLVGTTPRSKSSGGGSGQKAYINGKRVKSAMLKADFPDSFAVKALANPHAADPSRWGKNTRLNATQAVKADPELSKLVEWR